MLPAFGFRVYVSVAVHQPNDANAPCPRPHINVYSCKSIVLFEECHIRSVEATARTNEAQSRKARLGSAPRRERKIVEEMAKPRNEPYFEISTPPVAPRTYRIVSNMTHGRSKGICLLS